MIFDRVLVARALRNIGLLTLYAAGLLTCLVFGYLLRFDFRIPAEVFVNAGWIFVGIVGLKLLLLLVLGQFGSLLSYFGFYDLGKLLLACAATAMAAFAAWLVGGSTYAPPRAVIVTDLLCSFLFLSGFRLSLRIFREGFLQHTTRSGSRRRVAIIGAGDVGATLARDLQMRRGLGMKPVVVFY